MRDILTIFTSTLLGLVAIFWLTAPVSLESAIVNVPVQQPNWASCVKVYDGGMQGNGQKSIRFYNGCPERLYINACVVASDGETKLYKSGNRIMTNGNFTIYTFPFVTPTSLRWSAGTLAAAAPAPCTI